MVSYDKTANLKRTFSVSYTVIRFGIIIRGVIKGLRQLPYQVSSIAIKKDES